MLLFSADEQYDIIDKLNCMLHILHPSHHQKQPLSAIELSETYKKTQPTVPQYKKFTTYPSTHLLSGGQLVGVNILKLDQEVQRTFNRDGRMKSSRYDSHLQ